MDDEEVPEVKTAHAASLDEWQDIAGQRFVPVQVSATGEFTARMRWRVIEGATLSEITASAHRVRRLPPTSSDGPNTPVKLSLQLAGTGLVAQDGRDALLRPGDVAIYDTSRPYTLEFPADQRCLIMTFPHENLDVAPDLLEQITAVRLPGDDGIGNVIAPYMRQLVQNLDSLSGVAGARLVRSGYDLLATFLHSRMAQLRGMDPKRDEVRSYKLFIDSHLREPSLSASSVAQAHYISVRYLQYLFQEDGTTVSEYIRRQRLEHCRLDLADPAQAETSVLHIAQRWGFRDASHFSKLFRTNFGVSPRDFRAAAVSA